tara:strand:- start:130 stop:579 length:450 start_codon:yes stop_codon:yes gene_type:complete
MTLFQKDFNVDKMLAELKTPYDDIPKHKLRKLLIERDEEITTHIAEIRTLEKSDRLLEMAKRKLKKLNTENKELKEQIEINSKLYKSLEKSNEIKVKHLEIEIKCMELRHDYTMEYIQDWDSIHDWREELEEKAHKRGTWDQIMVFFDD